MRVLALLLCALLAAPIAWAGSADEPEITDATADVKTSAGAPACAPTGCQSASNFIDIAKAWVEQGDGRLLFRIQVTGNHNANAYGSAQYMVHFTVDGTAYEAGLDAGRSSTTGGDDSETPVGVADAASFQSDHVLIEVPLAAIGAEAGGVLAQFYARTTLDTADEADDSLVDRAPDAGFGNDFVIEGGGPEVVVQHLNVTGPLDHGLSVNDTSDASFAINWTAPANVSMELRVEGNGTVNVTILDPTGGGQFDCACTDGTNESLVFESEAGVWRVYVNYTAFLGTSSLSMAEVHAAEEPAPDGNGTPPDNDTGNGTGGGNGAPAPAAALLAVLVAVAWSRRRR